MTRIAAVDRLRFYPAADRTTWRVTLTCGAIRFVNYWKADRPVVGTAFPCRCPSCLPLARKLTRGGSLDGCPSPLQNS